MKSKRQKQIQAGSSPPQKVKDPSISIRVDGEIYTSRKKKKRPKKLSKIERDIEKDYCKNTKEAESYSVFQELKKLLGNEFKVPNLRLMAELFANLTSKEYGREMYKRKNTLVRYIQETKDDFSDTLRKHCIEFCFNSEMQWKQICLEKVDIGVQTLPYNDFSNYFSTRNVFSDFFDEDSP